MTTHYVVGLEEVDRHAVTVVGGKGAHLGELSRLEGLRVPRGFCVTTHAFDRVMAQAPSLAGALDRLSRLGADEVQPLRALSEEIRRTLEGVVIPDAIAAAIGRAHAELGAETACAVRSSATGEDQPQASFAGQQDTYLNVLGRSELIQHVSRCWASLFTERAVTYRVRKGLAPQNLRMAVVVQEMVFPEAAGVLFTADPVTGNRTITSVEASFGLGEVLVSGLVTPDTYKVRDGKLVAKAIACKRITVAPSAMGGTHQAPVEPARQSEPCLTEPQVLELAQLGRRLEAHFGTPQDIEWCLLDGAISVLQSRPITTLFPLPHARDEKNRVYISVGHQQMMTDPMKPLGLSLWQLTTRAPMVEAAGRLFVDVTAGLASPVSRAGLLAGTGRADPLLRDALETVLARDNFLPTIDGPGPPNLFTREPESLAADEAIVAQLIEENRASVRALKSAIRTKTGAALFEFILDDLEVLKGLLFAPRNLQVILTAMQATWWLKDHLGEWLGDKSAPDALAASAPGNVSAEMGLALLEVADTLRDFPDVVAFLETAKRDDDFLDKLGAFEGGEAARDALTAYLERYGMRCAGEIDITRPRWAERPSALIPPLLANIKAFSRGESQRRFEQGRQHAATTEGTVIAQLRALPHGERKAAETKQKIGALRTFIGYREYPKYGWMCRYFIYKQALFAEAKRLAEAGVLQAPDDISYLSFEELREVVRTQHVDHALIDQRKAAFRSYESLTPPRVLTSEGESITGVYRRDDLPPGALVGLGVSAGTVEGRARVLRTLEDTHLAPGDILVTPFTDPSWTPLFVTIKALVTEVGGLMTHGAVVAREYGLPAVVGVVNATQLLEDGQHIRVNGTDGYVEVLA